MFKKRTTVIVLRYILLLLNFIQLITILLGSKEQHLLEMSLPYLSSPEDENSVHQSMIVNISLSLTFLICEFLTFASGFTMFNNCCTLLSIFGHAIANIFLLYFINGELDILVLWWIFPFTHCIPLLCDVVTTFATIFIEGIH